jgi:16S rRNA (cytosine967-C5)-methyltransferase
MVNARGVALRALIALERGEQSRLREALVTKGLEPRDQAFAFELAHGVVRRQELLDHVLRALAHRGLPKDPLLMVALRLGAYQLLFVPGMPSHAAVHETVELVRGNKGFANAILRAIGNAIADRPADAAAFRRELALGPERTFVLPAPLPDDEAEALAVLHSLPLFLLTRWRAQFGTEGMRTITASATSTPEVWLRVGAATARDAVAKSLAEAGVETAPGEHARFLRWSGGASPFRTQAFLAGQFVVQDPTAFAAAEAVPCRPGATIVDLCAAPGTKTTALAERVRPGGVVFAYDIDASRRQRIDENVARLALGDVVRVVADVAQLPPADAVLADVPCSNSGVLARRVEVRSRLAPGTFAELAGVQRRLLAQAIGLCKPGGTVVYSTCSIDREENDDVVAAVLGDAATPRCERGPSRLTLPRGGDCDGGYFAVLRRT